MIINNIFYKFSLFFLLNYLHKKNLIKNDDSKNFRSVIK